ncbi:DinB family protein [Cellulomonas sp. NPDC089187]|uniref:DinB family protein n=1 Tax=Cellulomonas sp. NPDC089187 TaxID=3154970 RepID=UPI0034427FCA
MTERPDTRVHGGERELIDLFLDYQRATVVLKAEGLSDAEGARRLLPSATTVTGMLRHLADVERSWVLEMFAGLPYDRRYGSDEDPDGEWRVSTSDSLAEAIEDYRAACAESRRTLAGRELTETCVAGPPAQLRWVLLHLIEETARHAGQLDVIREQLDGVTGE